MKPASKKYIPVLIAFLALATACKVTQPYQAQEIRTDKYRDQKDGDTTSIASLSYAQLFTDTALQALIREGISNSPDIKMALARVRQFEVYNQQAQAAFYPSLTGTAGATESKLTEAQGFGSRSITQFQLGVSSSWEADIWGKIKSSRRASQAALLQSEAGARALQTSLVSAIASSYFALLALDEQLVITTQTVRNWDTTVTVMRSLKQSARVTQAAVVQSEAQRYAAEVTIPDLKQRIRETENALSILLGRNPGPIQRSTLVQQQIPVVLQTGIPAQLLANRPDVQQAEYGYRNAFELTNVARTAFYPSLVISGSAGLSSLTLGSFLTPGAVAANIGAGLTQPIFNRRLVKTNLEVAKASQEMALQTFDKALINAYSEVSNAVSLHESALEKMAVRANQLAALQKSVAYTQELLRNGFANYTEVITAKQSLLIAELGKVNDQLQQLQAVTNLYRALGGGWK